MIYLFSGLGQDDSEYIDLSQDDIRIKETLFEAFGRAGFASQAHGKMKLSPCPVGTFVNPSAVITSRYGTVFVECKECPAGKFNFCSRPINVATESA